jgi:phosphoglycolate phosphatase-like HAD superfamily hydrolase
MRKAIVDVDSILWNFLGEMKTRMRKMYPEKTIPEEFDDWGDPESLFDTVDEMIATFDNMHESQEQFEPFEGAVKMLQTLRDKGYRIHIASNRPPHTRDALERWLKAKNLVYDVIFAAMDKSVLFDDPSIDILIDDRPSTQLDGIERGFLVLTLDYKYNQHVERAFGFSTLGHMTTFIEKSVINA